MVKSSLQLKTVCCFIGFMNLFTLTSDTIRCPLSALVSPLGVNIPDLTATMDPVSIVLGVLPLVGSAFKAFMLIYERFQIFKHFSRDLSRIHKLVERQCKFFQNEVHLLLRHAREGEARIRDMLQDAHHESWSSPKVESCLKKALGKNSGTCQDIMEDICSALTQLQEELHCFDELYVGVVRRQKASPA